jgi:acyl carrier protein
MNAIEQEFGIKFTMGEIVAMKNVGEMANSIMGKIEG